VRRLAIGLVLLAGCGDADDEAAVDAGAIDAEPVGEELVGVWQLSSHTRDEDGCDQPVPVADPAYIRFVAGEVAGQRYVEWVACTDAGGLTCDAPGMNYLYYAEPIAGGARAAIYVAGGEPADCTLAATISDATLTGADLRVETRTRQQSNVTDTSCTTEDARARAATMPCSRFDLMLGARP
jgi:hypothetical protein